jgi:cytoskeletal protein CcmA (bactofilin family)
MSDAHSEAKMAIFKKMDEDERPELASPPKLGEASPVRSRNVSVIGPTLIFKGELSADEDLVIEGQIEGTIAHHEKNLTVGKQGRVKADIHAKSVMVLGTLIGDIHSDGTVSLAKGANVVGDIYCGRIVMEDGARFKGRIDMGEAPKAAVAPKESVKAKIVPAKERVVAEGRCGSPTSP